MVRIINSSRQVGSVAILTIMILLTALVTGPALADNAGLSENDTQPIINLPKDSTQLKLDMECEKDFNKLFTIFEQAHKTKDFQAYNKELQAFMKKWKSPAATVEGVVGALGTYRSLGVAAIGQETTYYCGPASAVQLLRYLNITRNPVDGRSTTQSNLARDLHTTTAGTPFPGWWETTLENWTGTYWTALWGPSENYLFAFTGVDVDSGLPLIYDTHMNSTNGYLPGYSSGDIYHYVTGDGYGWNDQNTRMIHYVDPNRYRTAAFGGHWVTNNLMWRVVRDRGIVW